MAVAVEVVGETDTGTASAVRGWSVDGEGHEERPSDDGTLGYVVLETGRELATGTGLEVLGLLPTSRALSTPNRSASYLSTSSLYSINSKSTSACARAVPHSAHHRPKAPPRTAVEALTDVARSVVRGGRATRTTRRSPAAA